MKNHTSWSRNSRRSVTSLFCYCAIAIIILLAESKSHYSFQSDDSDEYDFMWAIQLRTPFTRDATATVLFRVPVFRGDENC